MSVRSLLGPRRLAVLIGGLAAAAILLAVPSTSTDVLGQTGPDLSAQATTNLLGSIVSGQTLRGQIRARGSVDFYTFYAEAGQSIQVIVRQIDRSLVPSVVIIAPDGTVINGATGAQVVLDFIVPEDGEYTIQITGSSNTIGRYDVTLFVD